MNTHVREQLLRFARLFAVALVTQGVAIGHWDRSAVLAAVLAAAEVAFRQWKRTAKV